MKYQNIIILSVIILIVGILIYRWYFKSTEGFFGLSDADKLLSTSEVSTYKYLWSNNLYLEQFPENPPENLIVFQLPDQSNSSNVKKILGTMVTDSLEKLNKTTTVVGKDVKQPIDMKELFKYNNTSEPVFNKLFTYEILNEYKIRNDNVLNTLDNSLTELDEIFTKILSNVNANLYVSLYPNSLGDTPENKSFTTDENGNLVYTLNDGVYNAFTFPIGSKVTIITRNGQKHEFYIAPENMINYNNTALSNDDITYEKIFTNTNLTQHSYNPFGKYALGWKNFLETDEQKHKNANRMFNFNYGIGNSGNGLIEKIKLMDYIASDKVEKAASTSTLNNSSMNKYVKFNGKVYFVNHIVEIHNNDTEYNINATAGVYRKIYGNKRDNRTSQTGCSKKSRWSDDHLGTNIHCGGNNILINYQRSDCALGARRGYCVNNDNNDILYNKNFSGTNGINTLLKTYYVNREWIKGSEYIGYENVNISGNPNYNIEVKYINKDYYTNIMTDNYTTTSRVFNGQSINSRFNMNSNGTELFDTKKRNILACLWYDSEVAFPNDYTISNGNQIKYENDGYKPPYFVIKFVNKADARHFVANILNKIQAAAEVKKFRNPTFHNDTITLDNIRTTESNDGNTISQIKQNLLDVLENYNRYANEESSIKDDSITSIRDEIDRTINSFSSKIDLYYFNFMMNLPKFKIDNNGSIVNDGAINLADGSFVENELSNKIRNMTITINQNNNPIYKVLSTGINKLRDDLEEFKTMFINNSSKYTNIINSINNKELKHYPITIYRPIAPPRYKVLGDIVAISGYTDENSSVTYNSSPKDDLEQYGCVPEHCVVEARPWLVSDKVYEFNNNGQYLAIFRNPYLNTFKAVTQVNATPEGSVEKIVACVARSKIVDDLKHSDKCANEYRRGAQANINNNNLDRDNILFDKQEARLQNMLAERQHTIDNLKRTINDVQHQDRQAVVINHSMNRKRFQDLLDKQVYNMDQLISNLYSIISVNVNMKELVARLKEKGITQAKIQEIIDTLSKSNNLINTISTPPSSVPIEEVTTTAGGNEPDAKITKPEKLQRIIYRTQNGKEQEMILRSLVESSCGCYFTDDEVIKTR